MRVFLPLKIFRSLPHQYRWKMTNAFEITEVADKTFHYVIVGGLVSHCTTYWNQLANLEQTAGHTIATILTEDPLVSVVVLEAEQAHLDDPNISIGIGRALANLKYDWMSKTRKQRYSNDRSYSVPVERVWEVALV